MLKSYGGPKEKTMNKLFVVLVLAVVVLATAACVVPVYTTGIPQNYGWGHGQIPPPGSSDNPIVWRRYVQPGGREVYIPGPWRR